MMRSAHRFPRLRQLCRVAATSASVAAALLAGACNVPTTAPIVETRWRAAVESTRFGVGDLLPGAVTVAADSSAFVVDFDPVSFSASLGTFCTACALADGLTVPKPAFLGDFGSNVGFPSQVSSVTILEGAVRIRVTNGLNFDPLRPSAGVFGSLTISLTDGADGDVLGSLVVDGALQALPQGTPVDLMVPLQATTLDGAIETSLSIDSPLGDAVTIDSSLPIAVTATVEGLRVSEVAIDVSGESVSLDAVSFDLDDIGAELDDRVASGALLFDVDNPFEVGAEFQISISGSTFATIQRSVPVQGLVEELVRIDFTSSEIRNILSAPNVQLTGGAVVDPGAGIVRVQPGEELVLDATLDVELRIGG